MNRFQWNILGVMTFSFLFLFFYALNVGFVSSNDGSHLALIKSLEERGSTQLKENEAFSQDDSAVKDGRVYSDRNPGLSLFALVFIKIFSFLEPLLSPLKIENYRLDILKFWKNYEAKISLLMLIPTFSGAFIFLLSFWMLLWLGHSGLISYFIALSLPFSTLIFRYSTVMYSHTFASLLLLSSIFLLLKFWKEHRPIHLALGGFLLGYAVITEYALVSVIPVAVGLLWTSSRFRTSNRLISLFALSLIPSFLAVAIYNWMSFGSPFLLAHHFHKTFQFHHSLWTTFHWSRIGSNSGQYLFGTNHFVGMFSSAPHLLLFLLGTWWGFRAGGNVRFFCLFFFILLGAIYFPMAFFVGPNEWDRDHRYSVSMLPMFAPLLAATFSYWPKRHSITSASLYALTIGFYIWSWRQATLIHGYHLRKSRNITLDSLDQNWTAALINIPLFLSSLVAIGILVWGLTKWMRQFKYIKTLYLKTFSSS